MREYMHTLISVYVASCLSGHHDVGAAIICVFIHGPLLHHGAMMRAALHCGLHYPANAFSCCSKVNMLQQREK